MLKVQVHSRGVLIGYAELYADDPPMGVASGALQATPDCQIVRQESASRDDGIVIIEVGVKTLDGVPIDGMQGAAVADGPPAEAPALTVLGIAAAQYEAWFGEDPAFVEYLQR